LNTDNEKNNENMKKTIIMLIALLGLLAGCENKENLYSDIPRVWVGEGTGQARVDSVVHSFKIIDATQQSDTLYIPLHVIGNSAAVDRPVAVEVVAEEGNVPSSTYAIGTASIPANTFHGQLPVIIQRTVPGLDLTYESARLVLRLVANEHFELGVPGTSTFSVIWCDFLTRPETWSLINSVGPFSQARYKFIIDTTGEMEFSAYQNGMFRVRSLLHQLRQALAEYNADPSNTGRPEGWPYLDDDGTPLTFPT
jgi:hypothetical protein